MSEGVTSQAFLDHLLDSVLNEPGEAEVRSYEKKGRRGPRTFFELLPSDDDREMLDADDGKIGNALGTFFDAFGSKSGERARLELADLDGDDYEDVDEDEDDSASDDG